MIFGARLESSITGGPGVGPGAQRRRLPSADSLLEPLASPFAIRLPLVTTEVFCPLCGQVFAAVGPTGFCGSEPVCDHCLLVEEPHLGMVLALVAVARMHGGEWPRNRQDELASQAELLAFARIYDRFASRLGPPRPVVEPPDREPSDA